jgi:hypothetical protein
VSSTSRNAPELRIDQKVADAKSKVLGVFGMAETISETPQRAALLLCAIHNKKNLRAPPNLDDAG